MFIPISLIQEVETDPAEVHKQLVTPGGVIIELEEIEEQDEKKKSFADKKRSTASDDLTERAS
jgi:hypothetical protein